MLGCSFRPRRQFWYRREKKYHSYDVPRDFAYRIEAKENAPDLLRRALSRAPVDVVGTGDYQLAERRFGLSRRMSEVCLELRFPVSVLKRSPLFPAHPQVKAILSLSQ